MAKHHIWIIAGEPSGDTYGGALATALRQLEPDVMISGMGGAKMRAAGVKLHVDSTELAIVGVTEALKKLFFFLGLLNKMTRLAQEERPDAVVMIDYPGFNIRLAKRLKKLGIPVVYYVSPQVWAWKRGRVYTLADNVERMLCIFPFEPACYSCTSLPAYFVGHPLLELLAPLRNAHVERDPDLVLILPGSRRRELDSLLPDFLETAVQLRQANPNLHFALPLTDEKRKLQALDIIQKCRIPQEFLNCVEISVGNSRELMCRASAGLAASGTVTVESAILGLPVVVAYRVAWLTYWLARMVIKLNTLTIANLVTGKTVFQECIQGEAVAEKMVPAMQAILPQGARRQQVMDGIDEFIGKLGGEGKVSLTVAQHVLQAIGE